MALDNVEPTDVIFEKILHRGLRDESIRDVELLEKEIATQKGENFLGSLTRLVLKYVCTVQRGHAHDKIEKLAHLILKEEPVVSPESLENIREMKVFDTERELLEEVLPKIEKIIGRRLAPKFYYSSVEPQIIVMEDLAICGFKNMNRKLGLNEHQMLLVLEGMADLHAGSVLLNEQNPGSLKRFSWGLMNPNMPPLFFKTMEDTVASVAREVNCWPGEIFGPITRKLEKISKRVIETAKEVCKYDDEEFCVLNHGDLWVNNILFQNDEKGSCRDIRFVDYQFVLWSSPAIDLAYFLNAPEPRLKGTSDDKFLTQYLNRLSDTMNKIGCISKPPTMEHLKTALHKRRILLLLGVIYFFPKMVAEGGEMETIEDIFYKEKGHIDVMQNPAVRAMAEKLLPILNERGYLD